MSGLARTALENVEKIFLTDRQYIKAFLLFCFSFKKKSKIVLIFGVSLCHILMVDFFSLICL